MIKLSLLPTILLNEGKILKFDPGVCGVNPWWIIEYKGERYLLEKRIKVKTPEYPQGATRIEYYEIYKRIGDKWVPLE